MTNDVSKNNWSSLLEDAIYVNEKLLHSNLSSESEHIIYKSVKDLYFKLKKDEHLLINTLNTLKDEKIKKLSLEYASEIIIRNLDYEIPEYLFKEDSFNFVVINKNPNLFGMLRLAAQGENFEVKQINTLWKNVNKNQIIFYQALNRLPKKNKKEIINIIDNNPQQFYLNRKKYFKIGMFLYVLYVPAAITAFFVFLYYSIHLIVKIYGLIF